jgi:hypothetical protein
MSLNDLHSYIYIAPEGEMFRSAKTGEVINIPLTASFLTDFNYGPDVFLRTELTGWDKTGRFEQYSSGNLKIPYKPWMVGQVANIPVTMPAKPGLAIFRITLEDASGKALHHNFLGFVIDGPGGMPEQGKTRLVTFKPASFTSSAWSLKQWNVLDGLKVNGAGSGYFEYKVELPANIELSAVSSVSLILEASAKQLFGKDKTDGSKMEGDYMRGKGTFDNSLNQNSYPMTDDKKYPSRLKISVNGEVTGTYILDDDPADHRGILSWYSQPKNNKLNEAGSYGYLVNSPVPLSLLSGASARVITIRFEVDDALPGGLAIYGEKFGRYPLDPTLVFEMK